MKKRVTIMIDDDNDKKLRKLQARVIAEELDHYSYSAAINDVLRKALK